MVPDAMSYEGMARDLGLRYCGGVLPTGHYCRGGEHRLQGFVTEGTVHLAEPSRRDDLAFLRLAAQVIDPTVNEDIPWRRTYRIYRIVKRASRIVHVRVQGRIWNADRAFVLAGVAGLSNKVPMRLQAWEWARRPTGGGDD